ncbi:hypothetical protein DdX_19780 [Ditylenchus destructor]|uniref:Uncharacterized protein n=1 Tax=Ditylenchus destructor TaxID=166010 RepID=A0AAD4QWU4_9BILA|nr:hypothetical protein DdX_19780 [Ditylenchus destructor]
MIFEDELDLLDFNEEENDNNQAKVKQIRERQYFELKNFTEFRLTREQQVQQLVDEIGDLIAPNGHMGKICHRYCSTNSSKSVSMSIFCEPCRGFFIWCPSGLDPLQTASAPLRLNTGCELDSRRVLFKAQRLQHSATLSGLTFNRALKGSRQTSASLLHTGVKLALLQVTATSFVVRSPPERGFKASSLIVDHKFSIGTARRLYRIELQ